MLMLVHEVSSLSSITTQPPARLKDNATGLATLAHLRLLPSILTAGRKPCAGGMFLPELKALLPGHAYVERSCVAAFDEPAVTDVTKTADDALMKNHLAG